MSIGFSSKIELPSSAWLGSGIFQLGLAQLGKFQLKLITTDINMQKNVSKSLVFELIWSYFAPLNREDCSNKLLFMNFGIHLVLLIIDHSGNWE